MAHEEGTGHPSTSSTNNKVQPSYGMLMVNRRTIIDDVSRSFQCNLSSIKLSTIRLVSINSVQDESWERALQNTDVSILRSINFYLITITITARVLVQYNVVIFFLVKNEICHKRILTNLNTA